MKILYLVHCFYPEHHGGTEKFVLQLAQQCQAAGHTVKVVTYDRKKPALPGRVKAQPSLPQRVKAWLGARLRSLGINHVNRQGVTQWLPNPILQRSYEYESIAIVAFTHQRKRPSLIHSLNELRDETLTAFAEDLLARERPDLIHAGYLTGVAEFLHVAHKQGIPYVITLTDYLLLCPRTMLVNENQQLCHGPRGGAECRGACPQLAQTIVQQRAELSQQLLTNAQAVIAPSQFLAQRFQQEFVALPIQLIPYGIATRSLPANRRRYPNDAPVTFFFAGRFDWRKGIELLLAAFRQLHSVPIRLEIYGSGPLEPTVRQAAADDPRIHFGGVYGQSTLGALLGQVDVVVVPSTWHENLPLIMQEAQACGVPTLVADVGGMTECVTDGVNGFTFRVGDGADLQRKMQMIIDQPEILNGIKENMRNPKPGHYRVTSLEEEAAMYLKEYEKILGQSAINPPEQWPVGNLESKQ